VIEVEDSPIVRLVKMFLVEMVKTKKRAIRVRAGVGLDAWQEGAFASADMAQPPAKLHVAMIDRIKEMAAIPENAPLRFRSTIRIVGSQRDKKYDFDVAYSRSDGGGAVVVAQTPVISDEARSDGARYAWIQLDHADDALARDEVRARVREAIARVEDGADLKWLVRNAARTCHSAGLYDDALAYFARAASLFDDPRVLVELEAQTLAETHRARDGEESLRHALSIAETIERPHMYEVGPLIELAKLAQDRGAFAEAEAALTRADAVLESMFGAGSAACILPRPVRVRLMRERGDAIAAETLATSSLRDAERFELNDEADQLREELAEIALARGDAKGAVEQLRAVLRRPSREAMRAGVYAMMARAQRVLGRDVEALSSLRAAAALVDGALALDHPLRLDVERELATLTAVAPYR
jgi:tetratricopeptide (TPR) repeat protein